MTGNTYKWAGLTATLTLLLASASDAFAGMGGGTIVYGPPAESIPALSDAMLVVLGMLLAVLAYRVLRTYPGGRPLASLVALAIAGFSAASGTQVIQEAYAVINFQMTQPSGGTVNINAFGGDVPVDNATGRVQQIKSVTPAPYCSTGAASSPACAPGVTVQPESSCNVRFDCLPPS
jgi:hypothetical protein